MHEVEDLVEMILRIAEFVFHMCDQDLSLVMTPI